jgi:hypothetical protein
VSRRAALALRQPAGADDPSTPGGLGGVLGPGQSPPLPGGPIPGLPGAPGGPGMPGIPDDRDDCNGDPTGCYRPSSGWYWWLPLAGTPIVVTAVAHPQPPSRSALASKAALTNFVVGEGIAFGAGCVVGGLVAGGFTAVSGMEPLEGLSIPLGCVGGGAIWGLGSVPLNLIQSAISWGWTYSGH